MKVTVNFVLIHKSSADVDSRVAVTTYMDKSSPEYDLLS